MIRLFEKDETQFTTLGLCVLSDALSCIVTEELNGEYELTLEYPKNGSHFSDIKKDRLIFVKPNPEDPPEPFRIYQISKELKGVAKINARHISYDLSSYTVRKFDEEANSLSEALQKIQNGTNIQCPFALTTDIVSDKKFNITKPTNLRSVLGGDEPSILKTYEGEFQFNRFFVRLLKARGINRGFTIRYGKNLTDITQDITYTNDISGIYPFYSAEKFEYVTQEGKTYKKVYISPGKESDPLASDGLSWYPSKASTALEIIVPIKTDIAVQFANDPRNGTWANKIVIWDPSINRYREVSGEDYPPNVTQSVMEPQNVSTTVTLEDYEGATNGVLYLTGKSPSDSYKKILTLDLTSEFTEVPTQDELKEKTDEYIKKNKLGQIIESVTISFVKLSESSEYEYLKPLEVVKLGDTIGVYYESFGIVSDLKIEKTEYNVITNRYKNVTVGSIQNGITNNVVLRNDNISSLNNNAGYTDENKVTNLIAGTVTADYISATDAHLTNAQIEDLETYKIKCSGIIEASQGSIDELVAKLLTADNAIIKETLEAGNVTVKGKLISTDGFINNDFYAGTSEDDTQTYLLTVSTKDKKVTIQNCTISASDLSSDSISSNEITSDLVKSTEVNAARLTVGSIQLDPGSSSSPITKTITFRTTLGQYFNYVNVIVMASENVPELTQLTVNLIINEPTGSGTSTYMRTLNLQMLPNTNQAAAQISLTSGYTVNYSSQPIPNTKTYQISSPVSTYLTISGDVCPIVNNSFDLGSSTLKWKDIYAVNNVIQTSDRTQKKEINYDISKYDQFFDKLKPASYQLIQNESGRTHLGLIAQDVEQALIDSDLGTNDFAGFVKNKDIYGLRYNELHALEIYEIQQLKEKITILEKKLNELQK